MIHNSEWQPGHLEFTLLGHCVWKGGSSLSKSVSNETVMKWNLWMWLKLILRIQSLVILRHHSALITGGDYSWDWTWGSENSECWSPKAAGHPLCWVWAAVPASPEVRMGHALLMGREAPHHPSAFASLWQLLLAPHFPRFGSGHPSTDLARSPGECPLWLRPCPWQSTHPICGSHGTQVLADALAL